MSSYNPVLSTKDVLQTPNRLDVWRAGGRVPTPQRNVQLYVNDDQLVTGSILSHQQMWSIWAEEAPKAIFVSNVDVDWHLPHGSVGTTAGRGETNQILFQQLKESWKNETMFASDPLTIVMNINYLRIIAMGMTALPMIKEALTNSHDHWFVALEAITGHTPDLEIPKEGRIDFLRTYWLNWLAINC